MADSRTVSVALHADVKGYQASMRQAAKSTTEMDKAQKKAQDNAGRWAAIGTASTVAGAAIAGGLLLATKAASAQEQAIGALTATFKISSAEMLKNAENADQMGLSMTDYANSAARLGGQLANLGVDQADLAGTTDGLVRKAADLAAQYGGTTADAVAALGAAFRGEADPAERYSLALSGTAVKAEMLATGADKATAMLKMINDQMGRSGAAGAMEREFDMAASATQRAQANFDDATASLGKALLPAMAGAAEAASTLLEKFNALSDGTKQNITKLAAVGAIALIVGPRIAVMTSAAINLKRAMDASGGAAGGAGSKMKGFALMAGKIGAVGVAASIAIPIIAEVGKALNEMTEGHAEGDLALLEQQIIAFARNGGGELGRFAGDAEGSIGEIGASVTKAGDIWHSGFEMFGNQAQVARDQLNTLDAALVNLAETDPEQAAIAFSKIEESTLAAGGSIEDLRGAFPEYVKAVDAGALAADNAAAASTSDADAKEKQAEMVKKATEKYEAYIAAVQEALDLMSAKDALIGQEGRLADAVKKNGSALEGQTKKAAANRAAMGAEVSSIMDLVQAKYDETGSLEAAENVRKKSIESLKKAAKAAGYDKDEVNGLLKKLDLLKPVTTMVTVDGLHYANKQAAELAASLKKIVDTAMPSWFADPPTTPKRGKKAAGGLITGPGTGTSDDIPANLSNGEFVLRASAVKRIGVAALNRMNYAKGGQVGKGKKPKMHHTVGGPAGTGGDPSGGRGIAYWEAEKKAAKDALRTIKQEAKDYSQSIADNVLSGTGLFDMFSKSKAESATQGLTDAQDKLAEASRKVAEAQVAVNTASPSDRASALKNLADAQRDLATAQTDQAKAQAEADAAAPTPANIMGKMKARADAIGSYATKVKKLMGKGLSMGLIKELAGADMVEAGPVLDALLTMDADQLKELGAVDKKAKDAAASIGDAVSTGVGVPGGGAFGGKIDKAQAELGVNTDGLKDAIHDADKKFLDKGWRKTLAKAGLSAEERVQLMQSLRANDGKLTKHWRQKLAKAGLGAEERGDLVDTVTGAEAKLEGYSQKERNATLRAQKDGGFDNVVATAGGDLDTMTNKERKAFMKAMKSGDFDTAVSIAGGDLDTMTNKERKAFMQAAKAAGFDTDVKNAKDKVDEYAGDRKATMRADKEADHDTEVANAKTTVDGYKGQRKATLRADKEADHDTEVGKAKETVDGYKGQRKATMQADKEGNSEFGHDALVKDAKDKVDGYAGERLAKLRVQADTQSAKQAAYSVAYAAWKVLEDSGMNKYTHMPKPKKKDFGLAVGGMVTGPGTGTSDTAGLYALSNGEYVVRAASVSKYGPEFLEAINTGRLAGGGQVGYRTTTSAPSGGTNGVVTTSVPVIVQIDGRTIAQSQLKLQRQSGGTVTVGG